MIHAPNLTALRYDGEEPIRFKHLIGVRAFPMLSEGDIILVPSLTAHQLRKKTEFVVVDLNEVLGANIIVVAPADEGTQEETKAPADDVNPDGDKAPTDDVNPDGDKAPADDVNPDGDKAPADDVNPDGDKAPADDVNPDGDKAPADDVNPDGDKAPIQDVAKEPKVPKPLGKH